MTKDLFIYMMDGVSFKAPLCEKQGFLTFGWAWVWEAQNIKTNMLKGFVCREHLMLVSSPTIPLTIHDRVMLISHQTCHLFCLQIQPQTISPNTFHFIYIIRYWSTSYWFGVSITEEVPEAVPVAQEGRPKRISTWPGHMKDFM